jgi:L-ascorbate metabolism protein UlaG (beta-lactamase superfamily)
MRTASYGDAKITALGHAGFLVDFPEHKLRFAFDPYSINGEETVDYIFISHKHYDHCDPVSIRKLVGKNTKIIAPASCEHELEEFSGQVELVSDKEKHSVKQLTYWTVPAYNLNKFRTPSEVFHTRDLGGVGFVVEIGKIRFYHAGDTDHVPEMDTLKKIDVAFLPISGTYVMTLEEAIEAARTIKPKVVVPMHYGKLLGSVGDAVRYQNLLQREEQPVMVLNAHPDHT